MLHGPPLQHAGDTTLSPMPICIILACEVLTNPCLMFPVMFIIAIMRVEDTTQFTQFRDSIGRPVDASVCLP